MKRIKALREIAGFTQWDIAEFLNRDRSLVSMVENGRHVLSPELETSLIEFLEEAARDRFNEVVNPHSHNARA